MTQVGAFVTQPQREYLQHFLSQQEQEVILPLELVIECTATQEEMNANVAATIARGYEPFSPLIGTRSGAVSICGAGPSLEDHLGDLKGDVFAINSSHGYLLSEGISPKWAMIWDCDKICEQFAIPYPDTHFLLASRCHPNVFERLAGTKATVWHADGDQNIAQFLRERNVMEPLIRGGSAGVTRAIYVAYALGYRDFHIFGADSSYSKDRTHVEKSLVPEQRMQVMVGGRWFDTTPQMAAQVEEMKIMYPLFKHTVLKADMTVYGDGMLAHVMRTMKSDEESSFGNALAAIERNNAKIQQQQQQHQQHQQQPQHSNHLEAA